MSIGQCFLQFVGFLLQTIPIAALCLVPFEDKTLRFSRKKITFIFAWD